MLIARRTFGTLLVLYRIWIMFIIRMYVHLVVAVLPIVRSGDQFDRIGRLRIGGDQQLGTAFTLHMPAGDFFRPPVASTAMWASEMGAFGIRHRA